MLYDKEEIVRLWKAMRPPISGNRLAKLVGIRGPSMHAILNGKTKHVRAETLLALARVLGVPMQAILTKKQGRQDLAGAAAEAFSNLSPANQQAMLAAMQHLAAQQKPKT